MKSIDETIRDHFVGVAVRAAVWDEIQEALVEAENLRRWSDRDPLEHQLLAAMTSPSHVYATLQGRPRRCALCSHEQGVHSRILPFEPCLDCDCIGWTEFRRPNPSRRTRW